MYAVARLATWIVSYVSIMACVQIFFQIFGNYINIYSYKIYIDILLSLYFGWQIIKAFADVLTIPVAVRHGETAGRAVNNTVKLIGVGALVAVLAGAVSGGPAAAALGGFIGLVIGFATQQVLGQAVAGIFLLLAKPFKIGDRISAVGQEGMVKDITTMYTVIEDKDGNNILIPNNQLVSNILKIFR